MIKAVVFDLDGTLYAQRDYAVQGFQHVARKVAGDFHLSASKEQTLVRSLTRLYDTGQRERLFNWALPEVIPDNTARGINAYVERELLTFYKIAPRRLKVFRPVKPLFAELRRRGIRTALVTQGQPANQWTKLFALNLAYAFEAVEISGQYPPEQGKPSPFMFRKVLRTLGVDPRQAVYVGDNWTQDIGSVKAGMWFCYLGTPPGGTDPLPERVIPIRTLRQILTWMDRL